MKRLYLLFPIVLLICMLTVGMYCIYVAGIPAIGLNSLNQGEYAQQFQKHLTNAFPGKEPLQEVYMQMNGFYHYSGMNSEGEVQLLIPITNDAADHGASLDLNDVLQENSQEEPAPEKPDLGSNEGDSQQISPTENTPQVPEPTEPHIEEPPAEVLGQILLMGDRAIELPLAKYSAIAEYSAAVNTIAKSLPGVQIYSLLVPNAAGLYAPDAYQSGSDSQKDMIQYAYSLMHPSIKTIDAFSTLSSNKDKYLYFRTDHHWTHLGSYYAYTSWCKVAGIKAESLLDFNSGTYDTFLGTMYGFLSQYPQREVLRDNPDSLTYYYPNVKSKAIYYDSASMTDGVSINVIYSMSASSNNKYLCFLAGDHPITVIESDLPEERTCILIKESYGNAFATWLTSHYSKVICIDPREFNRNGKPSLDLAEFAANVGADDCIILNYPIMINSSAYASWLGRLVD